MSDATDNQAAELEPEVNNDVEPEITEPAPEPEIDIAAAVKRIDGLETALGEAREKGRRTRRELDYLRGSVDSRQPQQPQEPQVPELNITADEFWNDPVQAMQKVYASALHVGSQQVETRLTRQRINRVERQSRAMTKKHPEFTEAQAAFQQAMQQDPGLGRQAWEENNAAEFVWEWYQNRQNGSDSAQLQARIEELEAQLAGQPPGKKKAPKTQAGTRQAGAGGGADDVDDLTDIHPLDR